MKTPKKNNKDKESNSEERKIIKRFSSKAENKTAKQFSLQLRDVINEEIIEKVRRKIK